MIELCLYRSASNYWNVIRCIQGGIAALVSVTAAVDLYTPLVCAGIAAASSVLFLVASLLIHFTAIEDNCNFIASHLLCGFLGALACPILMKREFLSINRKVFILWQLLCLILVTVVSLVFGACIFAFLLKINILRSRREVKNHNRAVALQQHLPKRSFLNRLFHITFRTAHIVPGESYRRQYLVTKRESQDSPAGLPGDAGVE